MASGDNCQFGRDPYTGKSNGTVIHYDCDAFADGIVTDLMTGRKIAKIENGKITRF